jgi:uncharacterized protein YuzE
MPQNKTFKIDPVRTFASVMFIGTTAKLVFGDSSGRQEISKAGLPKWAAQCAAEFRTPFGQPIRELLTVGLDAEKDPGEGLVPGTLVELLDLEIGVMEKRNRDGQVVGVQVWHRASAMRPTSATAVKPRPAVTAAAGGGA